jgi:hypothetical protein
MTGYKTFKHMTHAAGARHALVLVGVTWFFATGAFASTLQNLPLVLSAQTPSESVVEDPGWPREYNKDGHQVVVYQPQIESWSHNVILELKCAIAVTPKGSQETSYGALNFETYTKTDTRTRMVLLTGVKIESVFFPDIKDEKAAELNAIAVSVLPTARTMLVSLDRILAGLEGYRKAEQEILVNLDPPPIVYSDKQAILIIFLGVPQFESVPGTQLLFATNTNWDLLLELGTSNYFLLNGDSWLTTKDLKQGPWTAAKTLPAEFKKLPDDENWKEVKQQIPGKTTRVVPAVFVSEQPAEMIITEGEPSYSMIPETKILYVTNTQSDLFLHTEDPRYYFLAAGRWFRAENLTGPWSAATLDLPKDFALIPADHPKGHILASVPMTPEADAAVLLASVPQKATVQRKEVTIKVVYEDDPEFVIIEGTSSPLYYAVNSPDTVFRVNTQYYCCHQGVWFQAEAPMGPWSVCVSVPQVIYSIPITHPTHNTTYVYVYESTPDTVIVGQTAGYTGNYAVAGVVMFGLGLWVSHELAEDYYYCPAYYYSYGCGARYDYYQGGYYRSAHAYGPYGGAGRGAAYNPATGTYARGAYRYGPSGGAFAREAYNPHTDRYAGQVGAKNPYGSWGRSVVSDGDDWARAGHRSNWEKSAVGFETSKGAKGVAGKNKRTGETGLVARDKHGDVYVGKDGNVYKKENGSWQQRKNGEWASTPREASTTQAQRRNSTGTTRSNRPSSRSTANRTARTTTQTPRTRSQPSRTPRTGGSSLSSRTIQNRQAINRQAIARATTQQRLNRQFQARRMGNARANNFSRSARSSGARGGRSRSRR